MMATRLSIALCFCLLSAAALAEDCRRPEPPPGVRIPEVADCKPSRPVAKPNRDEPLRAGREAGFMDLGNGTQVRIGGRVRVDIGNRH